ncbi:MAG: nuclear transport factor 2 family protein [Bacteroidia bacterium]|nr:nuclear transport factor 2 family protein [Bacteroidia bacterium]
MKRLFVISILFLIPVAFLLAQENMDVDKEAIQHVIQSAYVDGLLNNGDVEAVQKGFHPGFQLIGIGRGENLWNYPIYNWIADVKLGKAEDKFPRKEEEKVTVKFPIIDVTGTAAVAKLEFYVGKTLTYIDYMSLYKFGDDWKIVNKIFYKVPENETK